MDDRPSLLGSAERGREGERDDSQADVEALALLRIGDVLGAARRLASADVPPRLHADVVARLRSSGRVNEARALELARQVPAVLAFDDRSARVAAAIATGWWCAVLIVVAGTTWPAGAVPLIAAVGAVVSIVLAVLVGQRLGGPWARVLPVVGFATGAGALAVALSQATGVPLAATVASFVFWGSLAGAVSWRCAHLAAVRGWERRQLQHLRSTGFAASDLAIVRGLYDQALYGTERVTAGSFVASVFAALCSWFLPLALGVVALGEGEWHGAVFGLAACGALALALLTTATAVDRFRMWRSPVFGSPGAGGRDAITEPRDLDRPTEPLIVPQPRGSAGIAVVMLAGMGIASSTVLGGRAWLVSIPLSLLVAAAVWRRHRSTFVRIDESGIVDRRLVGTRRLAWSAISSIEPSTVAGARGAGVSLVDAEGERSPLIDPAHVDPAVVERAVAWGRMFASADVASGAGLRRRLRFFGVGGLACVALGLGALAVGALLGGPREGVDPATVPEGRDVFVYADGETFITCPSPVEALTGADTGLCAGAIREQTIAAAVFVVLLGLVIWIVARIRPGRPRG